MHNLLFCPHTLCMSYVTNTFLLVSSSVRSKQLLCFVHCQGPKREQKPTTKNFCRVSQPFPSINYGQNTEMHQLLRALLTNIFCQCQTFQERLLGYFGSPWISGVLASSQSIKLAGTHLYTRWREALSE